MNLQEAFSLLTPHQKTIIRKVENVKNKIIIKAKSAVVLYEMLMHIIVVLCTTISVLVYKDFLLIV